MQTRTQGSWLTTLIWIGLVFGLAAAVWAGFSIPAAQAAAGPGPQAGLAPATGLGAPATLTVTSNADKGRPQSRQPGKLQPALGWLQRRLRHHLLPVRPLRR